MPVSRHRTFCIEIFKTLTKLNPEFMNDIFSFRTSNYSSRNPNNLNHFRPIQVTFGSNGLAAIGPRIWDCLPNELGSAGDLDGFGSMIRQGDGPTVNVMPFNSMIRIFFNILIYLIISSFLYFFTCIFELD